MARFQAAAYFALDAATDLRLLPLRFERLGSDRFLVANLVGDLLLLTSEELERVVSLAIKPGDVLYERAFDKLLVAGKGSARNCSFWHCGCAAVWPSCGSRPRCISLS
jgi:uncharacterized protein